VTAPERQLDEPLKSARAHLGAGRLEYAEQAYRRHLKRHPEDLEALRGLGETAYQAGKYKTAAHYLSVAARRAPKIAEYQFDLGRAYRALGDRARAGKCFQQALGLKPAYPEARKNLGDLQAEQGQFERAAHQYSLAIASDQSFAEAYNNYGNVLKLQGRNQEAVVQYRQAIALKPSLAAAHNNLGGLLAEQGDSDEAEALFRDALSERPAYIEAHRNLARLLVREGRSDEAVAHFERSLDELQDPNIAIEMGRLLRQLRRSDEALARLNWAVQKAPDNPRAQRALGDLLRERGDFEQAVIHFRQAVEIEPMSAGAHNDLGLALHRQGARADAITHYQRALELDPSHAEAHANLGSVLERQGKYKEAEGHYRTAIEQKPGYAEAYCSLGSVLLKEERAEDAILALEKAIELRPTAAIAYNNLGNALQDQERYDAAIANYRKALEIDPDLAAAHANLGVIKRIHGHLDAAAKLYRRALKLQEDLIPALRAVTQVKTYRRRDKHVNIMERLLQDEDLDENYRSELCFALAKVNDDLGKYEDAFSYAEQGNTIEAKKSKFNAAIHSRFVDRTIATFSDDFFAQRRSFGSNSELPVFIVGLPRTGTTLVEQVLASHPVVFGAGELRQISELTADLRKKARVSKGYPEGLLELGEPACLRLAGAYLRDLRRLGGDAERVTDKMPFNFARLGFISLLFPKARIIHCRRHPADVFVSGYFLRFKHSIPFTRQQEDFAKYHRNYERVMAHWRQVLPVQMLEIDYEDMVADTEAVSRRLIAHCGLDWDDSCLEFYRNLRPVRTGSTAQVRQPIYQESVGRWHHYEQFLEPLMDALAQSDDG
jgi:tetratricopeptide (TPR) repeat protein